MRGDDLRAWLSCSMAWLCIDLGPVADTCPTVGSTGRISKDASRVRNRHSQGSRMIQTIKSSEMHSSRVL
jgi:hypothetical protein